MPKRFVTICLQIGVAKYMIKKDDLVWHQHHHHEKSGYFIVGDDTSTPGWKYGRRVMKDDGTIVKSSKVNVHINEASCVVLTPQSIQARYEDNVKAALRQEENELKHLMKFVK
ncbi:hypothetical protein D3C81_1742880 [compost metagenome]